MTQADINALRRFVGHMGRVFRDFPQLPPTVSNRTYNAYRLARRELPRVLRALDGIGGKRQAGMDAARGQGGTGGGRP